MQDLTREPYIPILHAEHNLENIKIFIERYIRGQLENEYERIRDMNQAWINMAHLLYNLPVLGRGGLEEMVYNPKKPNKNTFIFFFDPARDNFGEDVYKTISYVFKLFYSKLKDDTVFFWQFDQSTLRAPKKFGKTLGFFYYSFETGKPQLVRFKNLNKGPRLVSELVRFVLMNSAIRIKIPENYQLDAEDVEFKLDLNLLKTGEIEKEDL